jgi:predicted nucleic acid-binding protein
LIWYHVLHYRRIDILGFTANATKEYCQLCKALPRLGAMDLKIGPIALTRSAIGLPLSQRDFQQIPGWQIEDWS